MTQSYNLSQLANNLNSAGQLDATDGLVNAVPAANGGTGQSSYTVGDILYASGATALARLPDIATGNVLISGGVAASPSYGKVGLTTHVSGTLPVANGGTGATTLTANNVLLGNGTSAPLTVAPGTSGQVLTSNGTTWVSATISGLGYSQTWQNVLSSRVSGTTYTNSTGKPIVISVTAASGSTGGINIVVDGVVVSSSFDNTGQVRSIGFTIVPNGSTYQCTLTGSGAYFTLWSELR